MKKKNTRLLAILFAAITIQDAQGMLIEEAKVKGELNYLLHKMENKEETKKVISELNKEFKEFKNKLRALSSEIDKEKDKKKKKTLIQERAKEVKETHEFLIKARKELYNELNQLKVQLKEKNKKKEKSNLEDGIKILESIRKEFSKAILIGNEFANSASGTIKSFGHRVKDSVVGKSSKAIAKNASDSEITGHLESLVAKYRNHPKSIKKEFSQACEYHQAITSELLTNLYAKVKQQKFAVSKGPISAQSLSQLFSYCTSYLDPHKLLKKDGEIDNEKLSRHVERVYSTYYAVEEENADKKYSGWLKKLKVKISSAVEKDMLGANRTLKAESKRFAGELEKIISGKKETKKVQDFFSFLSRLAHLNAHLAVLENATKNEKKKDNQWIEDCKGKFDLANKDSQSSKALLKIIDSLLGSKKKSS